MAYPVHAPTPEQRAVVKTMSGYGVPQDDIAVVLDIDPKTLRKFYRRELDLGVAQANARIGETLFKQAVGGNTTAAIFWAKVRMGWTEKSAVEITGRISMPVEMTSAQIRAELAITEQARIAVAGVADED